MDWVLTSVDVSRVVCQTLRPLDRIDQRDSVSLFRRGVGSATYRRYSPALWNYAGTSGQSYYYYY